MKEIGSGYILCQMDSKESTHRACYLEFKNNIDENQKSVVTVDATGMGYRCTFNEH